MRELTKHLNILIAVLAVATFTSVSMASIAGSDHDFSNETWSGKEICQPCHTPHNAATNTGAPLWNHELTVEAGYTMYDGSTGDATIDFDIKTRLCLSCHDGTVALDSFGGSAGNTNLTGDALLGTDLSNDHPIGSSAVWTGTYNGSLGAGSKWTGGESADMNSQNPRDTAGIILLQDLPAGGNPVVGCTTCHEPHNGMGQNFMLRQTNDGSALCLNCHNK